jgi:heptosyltransferase II
MAKPERIIVMTPNWLGDAVMAFPAIGAVRHHRPEAALVVAARSSTAALFRMVTGVDEVVPLGAGGGLLGAAGWTADARALAAARGDVAILLPNSFRSAFTARKAGIPERWGYAADLRGRLLTRAVGKLRGRFHQADYYMALLAALDIPPAVAAMLTVPADGRSRADALLARAGVSPDAVIVGMAPGAAYGRAKQWPPDRFRELARLLHERRGAVSVLVGSRADRGAGEEIGQAPGLVNLIGETDLHALVGLMERCRAFVSNDSGAMHLAAAAGLGVTALFGSTDERGTAPLTHPSAGAPAHEILTCEVWCRPCMLRECPIDHRCMTGIEPARVCESVERRLSLPRASRAS